MIKEYFTTTKEMLQRHKKKLGALVVAVLLVTALSAGAHAMFHIQGIVTGVDTNKVTVANFFWSQTVDLTGAPVNIAAIKPGDRILIQKNLQGNVLYAASFAPGPKSRFGPDHMRGHGDTHHELGGYHEDGRR